MKAKILTFVRGLKNGTPPRFQSYLKSLTILLGLMLSVNVWADYTVTFNTASSDGSTANTTVSNYVNSSSTSYISSISTEKAYYNGKSGVKLGSSSKTGNIVLNLSTTGQVKASSISIVSVVYDSGKTFKCTVTYTDNTSTNQTFSFGASSASINLTSSKTVKSVKFESITASNGRGYISSFTIITPSGYTIDFECNGATSGCPSQLTNQTKLPDPLPTTQQKTGYSFFKWYTNSGLTAIATAGAAITANTKLYAKWNIINRTITYNGDEQLNYTAKPTNATIEDDGVEVTYSVNTGYEITGVSVTMGGTPLTENTDFTWNQDDVTIMPESGITGNIVVTFTTQLVQSCTHEITITKGTPSNGSFTLSQEGDVCIDDGNATVVVTPTPNSHFIVDKVTTSISGNVSDPDGDGKYTVSNISASTSINVTFAEKDKVMVTFTDNIHNNNSNYQEYVGDAIQFPIITDAEKGVGCEGEHYHFVGWAKDSSKPNDLVTPANEKAPSTNVEYYAVWAKEEL